MVGNSALAIANPRGYTVADMSFTLFIDTETTSKYHFKLPENHHTQPHLVQIGALLLDGDRRVRGEMNLIIRPDGWTIPKEASCIHGITQEIANECGVCLCDALMVFFQLHAAADTVVAHNIDFDQAVINCAAHRTATRLEIAASPALFRYKATFCTMRAMTPICQLPGSYGDYKWPKLQEAYLHAFGSEFDGAHDAMADVRACASLYWWLKDGGDDTTPLTPPSPLAILP